MTLRQPIALAALAAAISGCAYPVAVPPVSSFNIYSGHDSKVAGHYGLVLDQSTRGLSRVLRPASQSCALHTFPVTVGDNIAVSIKAAMSDVFGSVVDLSTVPTAETMQQQRMKGVIVVRLEEFRPRIACSSSGFAPYCTASTDVGIGAVIRGPEGPIFGSTAHGSRSVDGEAGSECQDAGALITDSITRAVRDSLERVGERMANAPRLRN